MYGALSTFPYFSPRPAWFYPQYPSTNPGTFRCHGRAQTLGRQVHGAEIMRRLQRVLHGTARDGRLE